MVDNLPELFFVSETNRLYPYKNPYGYFNDILVSTYRSTNKHWMGSGPKPETYEGFHQNPQRQRLAGSKLARLFALEPRGLVLDVGWGLNKFIAQGLSRHNVEIALLDRKIGKSGNSPYMDLKTGEDLHGAPTEAGKIDDKFRNYIGDINNILHRKSDLRKIKFGAIMFNGSWKSGTDGINFTLDWETPNHSLSKEQKNKLLKNLKSVLNEQGILYVGSSRYANLGAGYTFFHLPEEKVEFLSLVKNFSEIGARKITVLGLSPDTFQRKFDNTIAEGIIEGLPDRWHFRDSTTLVMDRLKVSGEQIVKKMTGEIENLPQIESLLKGKCTFPEEILHAITKKIARIDGVAVEFL